MSLAFANSDTSSTPLYLLTPEALEDWKGEQPDHVSGWLDRIGFSGAAGQAALIPHSGGELAVGGLGNARERTRGRFLVASVARALPGGTYHLAGDLTPETTREAALAWLFALYRFDRYKAGKSVGAMLKAPDGVDAARLSAIASGEALTRDLINTPASDMGPEALEAATRDLAEEFGAKFDVTMGDDLLANNLPMIHAVGRASPRAPRLIDMRWGDTGPTVSLVGKGVCFDTGGLNLKPGGSMGLMKKDMGGAATVLGLARMIMALNVGIRLRVLIPAVENAVSGNAFRPQDVLTSRKGLSVEINNTDAEGRLVLADALTLAAEEAPDGLISMATLTGAARVAVGSDIAPFYTDDDTMAAAITRAGSNVADPVWRMPFHDPYESMIEPAIADLDNAPKGGMAGSITAALFLRRFAEGAASYTHFDIYGWQPFAAPGRPVGGVGQGARALLEAIPEVFGQ